MVYIQSDVLSTEKCPVLIILCLKIKHCSSRTSRINVFVFFFTNIPYGLTPNTYNLFIWLTKKRGRGTREEENQSQAGNLHKDDDKGHSIISLCFSKTENMHVIQEHLADSYALSSPYSSLLCNSQTFTSAMSRSHLQLPFTPTHASWEECSLK